MARTRIETGETLRRISRSSISFNRFNQLREHAKKTIGYSTEVVWGRYFQDFNKVIK